VGWIPLAQKYWTRLYFRRAKKIKKNLPFLWTEVYMPNCRTVSCKHIFSVSIGLYLYTSFGYLIQTVLSCTDCAYYWLKTSFGKSQESEITDEFLIFLILRRTVFSSCYVSCVSICYLTPRNVILAVNKFSKPNIGIYSTYFLRRFFFLIKKNILLIFRILLVVF
jgi:hypothetical protein